MEQESLLCLSLCVEHLQPHCILCPKGTTWPCGAQWALASQNLVGWGFWLVHKSLPHFWGSLGTPTLQLHLSLLLGLSSCCLLPLRLGAHCCGHTGLPWSCSAARVWRSRGWHRAGWGSSACLRCAATLELLPGGDVPMPCKGLMCSVGLSDVLSHSWGLFLFKEIF